MTKKNLIIFILAVLLLGVGFLMQFLNHDKNLDTLIQASLFNDEFLERKKQASQVSLLDTEKLMYPNNIINCDVLVAGGGASGVTAALQSARLGAQTCLIEETNWIGGMLTSAGVSSIDGNLEISSGINKEFIKNLQSYYKGKNQLELTNNCTAGTFCYEPKVGQQILREMLDAEQNLSLFLNAEIVKTYSKKNILVGLQFKNSNGQTVIAESKVIIDATELGDIMHLASIPYDLGPDKGTTESLAKGAESCIQPITYVAILKKSDSNNNKIPKPKNYDPANYACLHNSDLRNHSSSNFDIEYVKQYGALPNDKIMLNIPSHSCGNDYNHDVDELDHLTRDQVLENAKNYTLGLVYYLQEWLNYTNYALYNEFDTEDKLAIIPYVRESRRLIGVERLVQNDILAEDATVRPEVKEHSIAIGSYPIDLHFCTTGIGDVYQRVQPYQIPYEVLIPKYHDGFLAAEKNISVSRIVNGSTRVQPSVMSVGQAAGAAAALSVQQGIQPRNLDPDLLQETLLQSKSTIHYFRDLKADHFAYETIVKHALSSNISGYKDLTFNPDLGITRSELKALLAKTVTYKDKTISLFAFLDSNSIQALEYYFKQKSSKVTYYEFVEIAYLLHTKTSRIDTYQNMLALLNNQEVINQYKKPDQVVTRAEAIVVLDRIIERIYQDKTVYNS